MKRERENIYIYIHLYINGARAWGAQWEPTWLPWRRTPLSNETKIGTLFWTPFWEPFETPACGYKPIRLPKEPPKGDPKWVPVRKWKLRSRLDGSSILSLGTCPEGCPETVLISGGWEGHDFGRSEEVSGVSGQPGRAWKNYSLTPLQKPYASRVDTVGQKMNPK